MTGRRKRPILFVLAAGVALSALVVAMALGPGRTIAAKSSVNILAATPSSLDPAAQADAGTAQVVAQLYECLTAVDNAQHVEPALASSWDASEGGKRVTFHLRSGLEFSDGSPLTASDVVASWMRVLSPTHPSQLASLLDGVVGAREYREGSGSKSSVGISAPSDSDVQVDLNNPESDLPAIMSSPTLAIVPKAVDTKPSLMEAGSFVGSGGYVLTSASDTKLTLTANSHYWAGKPAIRTVNLILDTGGQSEVDMFEAGDLDYTPISAGDATWISYDKRLGPSLRLEPSPSVMYYGFDASKAPFNDVHVRRAFELGIDWKRLVTALDDPITVAATGMVPAGVPGHSTTDYGPKFDLTTAKSELAAAGYSGGSGFPKVTLVTSGAVFDAGIVRQLHDNLGVDISYEQMGFAAYNSALTGDKPPAFWEMDWVADYPGAYDFLGILLGSHQPNNFAHWSDSGFESALATAEAASDQTAMQAAFDKAQSIVQDQAPVIPVTYGAGYSLAAKGLLGALPNSEGIVRYAGLAWGS